MAKIYYSGDQNIEHGGVWYKLNRKDWDSYGYCSAVRVTPCSDAGAQDNAYWVEELTVIKPDSESDLKSVLDTCCWHIDSSGDLVCSYRADPIAKKGTAAFRHAIAESCVGYGKYDIIRSETVQIGKTAEFCGSRHEHAVPPDTVLRANASLERWIRKNFIRGL